MRTAKTLIRLGGCPGWSESSLGAHATLLVLSRGGWSCGYILEFPWQGNSNEYPQYVFMENCWKLTFSYHQITPIIFFLVSVCLNFCKLSFIGWKLSAAIILEKKFHPYKYPETPKNWDILNKCCCNSKRWVTIHESDQKVWLQIELDGSA